MIFCRCAGSGFFVLPVAGVIYKCSTLAATGGGGKLKVIYV